MWGADIWISVTSSVLAELWACLSEECLNHYYKSQRFCWGTKPDGVRHGFVKIPSQKPLSPAHHAYMSQRWLGASGTGFAPSLALSLGGLTWNLLWGAGDGRSLPSQSPSQSSFSPKGLGTFHSQLVASVLPSQLAEENLRPGWHPLWVL